MNICRISVVVPVFNSHPDHLREALDSLAAQTLENRKYEVIVVDDGSTHDDTLRVLEELRRDSAIAGISLRVLRHEKNRWLAAARVTGARSATSDYLLFLDSDDRISPDYLKKAVTLLDASPAASWVYPTTRCFGDIHEWRLPKPFNVIAFFLRNAVPYASVYRRSAWCSVSQRERLVTGNVRFFEDWDTTIRLMAKGHFGLALADAVFHYRKRGDGLNERPTRLYLLSIYTTWRSNLHRIPLIALAQIRYARHHRLGFGRRSRVNPLRALDKLQTKVLQRALETDDLNAVMSIGEVLTAVFFPRRFISNFLDPECSITIAELRCGFFRKPDLSPVAINEPADTRSTTILFAHTWWAVGGTEKVLLNWCASARRAGFDRILEVTQYDSDESDAVRAAFAETTDEQYCLARTAANPRDRLLFLWHLICSERPGVVFISGNPSAYILAPLIRKFFPSTVVVDILHNEWRNRYDWFSVAYDYQEHLNRRIVISHHWRDVLVRKYDESPDKIEIHHNFVDTDWFRPLPDKARQRALLGIEKNARVITFVGRLHDQKDPGLFCEVARRFSGESSHVFVVVGGGPLEHELQSRYPDVGNLIFTGELVDVRSHIGISDVVVFTSRFEGFPLASLEAASMNVPVIAPDIVGFDEQVRNGNIGLLYEPTGEQSLDCHRIESLIRDRSTELTAIGAAGRSRQYVQFCHSRKVLEERQVQALTSFRGRRVSPHTDPRLVGAGTSRTPLLLHIGWHKTGSSTIQHFLHHNRALLDTQGFVYPSSLSWDYAHHVLQYYFSRASLPPWVVEKLPTYEAYERWASLHLDGLARNPDIPVILSSETFRIIEASRFADRLAKFDTRMVVFLRRQDSYIESSLNQQEKMRVKFWRTLTREQNIARLRKSTRDYAGFLDAWADAFGRENITVVPFEKRHFPDGLERYFVELAGMKWDSAFAVSGMKNTRLNRDCMAFLSGYQEDNRIRNHKFHRIVDLLEEYSKEHPDPEQWRHVLSPAERLSILDDARPYNSRVAREYLGRSEGQLFGDPEPRLNDPWEPYPGLDRARHREILEFLLDNGAEFEGEVGAVAGRSSSRNT